LARYRHKDETDLRWNRIRRRLTTELDAQIKDWREEALNNLLAGAWDEFAKALNEGDILELETEYETWVARALNASVADREVQRAPEEG
jgi:hypothetical protein